MDRTDEIINYITVISILVIVVCAFIPNYGLYICIGVFTILLCIIGYVLYTHKDGISLAIEETKEKSRADEKYTGSLVVKEWHNESEFDHERKNKKDGPGCYFIRIYNPKTFVKCDKNYEKAYIGQSIHVYKRLYDHLRSSSGGKPEIKVAIAYNKVIYYGIIECDIHQRNDLEKRLIEKYRDDRLCNIEKGGAKKYNDKTLIEMAAIFFSSLLKK